jgi:hypothetical protein
MIGELAILGTIGWGIKKIAEKSRQNSIINEAGRYLNSKYGDLTESEKERVFGWIERNRPDPDTVTHQSVKDLIDEAYENTVGGSNMHNLVPTLPWKSHLLDDWRASTFIPTPRLPSDQLAEITKFTGRGFRSDQFELVSNEVAKNTLVITSQDSVPHLTHLAQFALAQDPLCSEVEVTDTFRVKTPSTGGFFGRSGSILEGTRTVTVKKKY